MHKVIQGQKERLCKDGRGQDLNALLLGTKGRGHKYDVQRDI